MSQNVLCLLIPLHTAIKVVFIYYSLCTPQSSFSLLIPMCTAIKLDKLIAIKIDKLTAIKLYKLTAIKIYKLTAIKVDKHTAIKVDKLIAVKLDKLTAIKLDKLHYNSLTPTVHTPYITNVTHKTSPTQPMGRRDACSKWNK